MALDLKAKDVLRKLMDRRLMMTINSTLDDETASMIAREFGADVKMQTFEEEMLQVEAEDVSPEDVVTRAPVDQHRLCLDRRTAPVVVGLEPAALLLQPPRLARIAMQVEHPVVHGARGQQADRGDKQEGVAARHEPVSPTAAVSTFRS